MGQGENKGWGRGCCTLRGVWGNCRTLGREGRGGGCSGGALGVLLPSAALTGVEVGGGRALKRTPPPHRCCLPSEDPPIPMEAAAKFLNHIGGCHPQTLPGMR